MLKFVVAVVEPCYEINIGHIARLIKNFGVRKLILINPKFNLDEAKVYSAHAQDILDKAEVLKSFQELRKNFNLLIGTTAIKAKGQANIIRNTISLEELLKIPSINDENTCIVLGRDGTGLNNKELALCDVNVTIDTGTKYRTLNISHALAIFLYEIFRTRKGLEIKDVAEKYERDLIIMYAKDIARLSNLQTHKIRALEYVLKSILARTRLKKKEAKVLLSFLRKAKVALEESNIYQSKQS
jgi:TrmH family RNA methyltransferase